MQYVVVLEINENELDGDDSIENACSIANYTFAAMTVLPDGAPITVRPLSEVLPRFIALGGALEAAIGSQHD